MDIQNRVSRYLMLVSSAIQKTIMKDIDNIVDVLSEADKIYTIGNGGSAATALHFALDLHKAAGKNAMCLASNIPLLTAYANDDGYESIFASQLKNAGRKDALVAFSCSGNSLNVVRAIRFAKELKMTTIGFTGDVGGILADEVDYVIKVPYGDIKIQEDVHLAFSHAITGYLEK